jgi:ABC-type lipoprotein export system ATPase subunit
MGDKPKRRRRKIDMKYPKGAEWRKWDLHLHSNASDGKSTPEEIIEHAKLKGLAVIAITDHHTTKNIDTLKELGAAQGINVISGIEFRTEYGDKSVHIIGLFPEYFKETLLDSKALHDLVLSPLGLSETIIISKGKENNSTLTDLKAFKKGMFLVQVEFKKAADLIRKYGGIVTVHAGDKANSIEQMKHDGPSERNVKELYDSLGPVKKELLNNYIDICEIKNENDSSSFYFNSFGKTSIVASDAHKSEDIGSKYTWIKADPTFEGLKQVINEPTSRVYIGDTPSVIGQVAHNKTKYIKEIIIRKVDGYDGKNGIWFDDISIPLNSELVSIIGNKGSGKSALADIMSLCANYLNSQDFSFLHHDKFRNKKSKLAENFEAQIVWESGTKGKINLNDDPKGSENVGVKYLPQGRFEKLTNEVSAVSEFKEEIEKVVFSHIPDEERLNTKTFNSLVKKKTKLIESEIENYQKKIKKLIVQVIELEKRNSKAYQLEVKSNLKEKIAEFDALEEPVAVPNPNDDPQEKKKNKQVVTNIEKVKNEIKTLEVDIKNNETTKKEILNQLHFLKDTKKGINLLQIEYKDFINDNVDDLSALNIDINKLINMTVNLSDINEIIKKKNAQYKTLDKHLGELGSVEPQNTLYAKREVAQLELKKQNAKLDIGQKEYQDYLLDKEKWEKAKKLLKGNINKNETIEYYKGELKYLENKLNIDIAKKYDEILKNSDLIFEKKQKVVSIYKDVRNRLENIIISNKVTLTKFNIEIDATLIKKSDFNLNLFHQINHTKKGTFCGKEGAEKQLNLLFSETNFDDKQSVISFLKDLIDSLKNDKRDNSNNESQEITVQVKDMQVLYYYLFSLQFLDINYQLKQGGKGLEQLSPGERGALLLVFYLILDKDTKPLIIDQPEDNLDNHSVATILVPLIRESKIKRQIIMVTHNPNLAVVADAEQIIYVDIDKENKYKFSAISGSIENKVINEKIVKVLEGAMPAFNKRKSKYYEQ